MFYLPGVAQHARGVLADPSFLVELFIYTGGTHVCEHNASRGVEDRHRTIYAWDAFLISTVLLVIKVSGWTPRRVASVHA